MHALLSTSLLLLSVSGFAAAQTCTAATKDLVTLQDMVAGATVDNAGGEWGADGTNSTFNGAAGIYITPTRLDGYWFMKFETKECWDGSGYNAFEFDMTAPVGSTFDMTLTTHTANCSTRATCKGATPPCTRGPDSTYVSINASGIVPNGKVQHVTLPYSLFVPNSLGTGTTDFAHIKDWTFINFRPLGARFVINNFIVKAGCMSSTAVTTGVAAKTTAASKTSSSVVIGAKTTGSSAVTTAAAAAPAATTTKSGAAGVLASAGRWVAVAVAAVAGLMVVVV